jgi:hypothetical protein
LLAQPETLFAESLLVPTTAAHGLSSLGKCFIVLRGFNRAAAWIRKPSLSGKKVLAFLPQGGGYAQIAKASSGMAVSLPEFIDEAGSR